jgi:chaperonin GroES
MATKKTKLEVETDEVKPDPLELHRNLGRTVGDRIVVFPDNAEQRSAGGIIIPDSAQEKPVRGLVVAVGPGRLGEPMSVKVGDHILYGKYAGTETTIKGRDYLIMRESEILLIF